MIIARAEDRAQIEAKITRPVARYIARSARTNMVSSMARVSFVSTRIPTSLNPRAPRTVFLSGSDPIANHVAKIYFERRRNCLSEIAIICSTSRQRLRILYYSFAKLISLIFCVRARCNLLVFIRCDEDISR